METYIDKVVDENEFGTPGFVTSIVIQDYKI